jgi:ribosomal protein S6--L-glutamate ligase
MLLHLLTFSNGRRLSEATRNEIAMFQEAAQKRGHRLEVISSDDCQMQFDQKPGLLIRGSQTKDIKILIVRANFLSNVEFLASIVKQFELAKVPVINAGLPVMRAKNKFRTMQILSDKKVPMPKAYMVGNPRYIDDVIQEIGKFPVILKTVTGSHGSGVSIIESKRGLKSIVEMIMKDDKEPLIVQKYIKESKGRDIRVFIVGKKIIGAMERIASKRGEFRSNFHLGGRVRVAEMSKKEKKVAFAAVRACGLEIAGVDILRTNDGPQVLEVNANPGLEGITKATGRDVAGKIIEYAVRKARAIKKKKELIKKK